MSGNPVKVSLDEWLAKKGVSFPVSDYTLDKTVFPHGLSKKQHERLMRNIKKSSDDYQQKRSAAIQEYEDLVRRGLVIPKTSLERVIEKARFGHPDNESTKAAKRLLKKKGIDI